MAEIAFEIAIVSADGIEARGEKGRLYARAVIGCYWIINLVDGQVEVYTPPSGPGPNPAYGHRQDYLAAASVPLLVGGQVANVAVAALLPP